MPDFGPAELIIILVIVAFIFGGSRLAEIGSSLGRGVKEFRSALREDDKQAPLTKPEVSSAGASLASAASGKTCGECGSANDISARFCTECGKAITQES
jgi:sec-independent protein translocase protein TatA